MIPEIGGAIAGIKSAMDIAGGIRSLKSDTEIHQAIIDIQRTLLDAQAEALTDKQRLGELLTENASLKSEIAKFSDWQSVKARYRLAKSELGAFFYEPIPDKATSEPYHRLCATCFEQQVVSYLHTKLKSDPGEKVTCHRCDRDLKLTEFSSAVETVSVRPRTDYDWMG
jgi:hypothetical protein